MREINEIIIHCSATIEGNDVSVDEIRNFHKLRGFIDIGYHYVIYRNGIIVKGRDIEDVGAHCKGKNEGSIGICYIGGLDKKGKAKDTRTPFQKKSLRILLKKLILEYRVKKISGHYEYSAKECPCFDVNEYKKLLKWV